MATLLVSHVLSELAPVQLDALLDRAAQCAVVIWVEPGSFDSSRRLIAVRERLRDRFRLLAPCTHQETCGLLVPENARHWCHQFAASPPEIYQDANWSRFARTVGVDLRSLPLSFLVLDRRAVSVNPSPLGEGGPSGPGEGLRPETVRTTLAPLSETALRLLGRPRMEKARALLFGCDRSGVRDRRFLKRRDGAAFRQARHGDLPTLLLCRHDGDEIMELSAII
jgi:ribosomal protein RSM22 (predicted rRNA methylase)